MRVFFVDFENKCQSFITKGARQIEEKYGSYPPIKVHFYHSYGQRSPQVPQSLKKRWIREHIVPRGRNAVDKQLLEAVRAYRKKHKDADIFVVSGFDKTYRQLELESIAEVVELEEVSPHPHGIPVDEDASTFGVNFDPFRRAMAKRSPTTFPTRKMSMPMMGHMVTTMRPRQ